MRNVIPVLVELIKMNVLLGTKVSASVSLIFGKAISIKVYGKMD